MDGFWRNQRIQLCADTLSMPINVLLITAVIAPTAVKATTSTAAVEGEASAGGGGGGGRVSLG